MNIEAFEKRAQILKMRSKIMMAKAARLSNKPTVSLDEARKRMREKLTAKPTVKLINS